MQFFNFHHWNNGFYHLVTSKRIRSFAITLLCVCDLNHSSTMCFCDRSSMLAKLDNAYAAFYIDWAHQFLVCVIYYTLALASVLIFIGLCSYLEAMTMDLRLKLTKIEESGKDCWTGVERGILKEMQFHRDILQLRNLSRIAEYLWTFFRKTAANFENHREFSRNFVILRFHCIPDLPIVSPI